MINLLPPQVKDDYKYARRNTSLLRVITSLSLGLVGLVVITAAGFFYLQMTTDDYKAQADDIRANLVGQKQGEVNKEVQEISERLKLAVQVLSKEILFSELLKQLAKVTPSQVSLSTLTIDEFGGGIDITAEAANYQSASQLHVNVVDPANKIFAKADIVDITCDSKAIKRYPCIITIRALFTPDNPFLFINDKGVSTP